MGFNRKVPDATASFLYIVSLDTAINVAPYPPCEDTQDPAVLGAYRAAFLATDAGQSLPPEQAEFLSELETAEGLTVFCQRRARRQAHKAYRESGDEKALGELGADVIRWKLHNLPAPKRATVKGLLSQGNPNLTDYDNKYQACRFILRHTLIGAQGWDGFALDKATGHVSEKCLDAIDDEWVIEMGNFVFDLPELRKDEKKA